MTTATIEKSLLISVTARVACLPTSISTRPSHLQLFLLPSRTRDSHSTTPHLRNFPTSHPLRFQLPASQLPALRLLSSPPPPLTTPNPLFSTVATMPGFNQGSQDMSYAVRRFNKEPDYELSEDKSLYYDRFLPYGGRALEGSNERLQEDIVMARKAQGVNPTAVPKAFAAKPKITTGKAGVTDKRDRLRTANQATAGAKPKTTTRYRVVLGGFRAVSNAGVATRTQPAGERPTGIRKPKPAARPAVARPAAARPASSKKPSSFANLMALVEE